MSNQKDFAAKQSAALALPKEMIETPHIPVGIYIQEAEDLYQIATTDLIKLKLAGLNESELTDMQICAGACREAQSLWMKEMQTRKNAEEKWMSDSPKAYELRDYILHAFRFAFRKQPVLLKRVAAITEGTGNADMIQDLNDLSILGTGNEALLTAVNFDIALLKKASTLSGEMANLLALANGDRTLENTSKEMRDRMFTLLQAHVDEIRCCGRFVFHYEEQRQKLYTSAYKRKMRNSGEKDTDTTKK